MKLVLILVNRSIVVLVDDNWVMVFLSWFVIVLGLVLGWIMLLLLV